MKQQLKYYMGLDYPVVISKITCEGEQFYKAAVPDLPGLEVYVEKKDQLAKELKESKLEWFAFNLKYKRNIPLPNSAR